MKILIFTNFLFRNRKTVNLPTYLQLRNIDKGPKSKFCNDYDFYGKCRTKLAKECRKAYFLAQFTDRVLLNHLLFYLVKGTHTIICQEGSAWRRNESKFSYISTRLVPKSHWFENSYLCYASNYRISKSNVHFLQGITGRNLNFASIIFSTWNQNEPMMTAMFLSSHNS